MFDHQELKLELRQQWRTKNYHSSYRYVPTIRAAVEAAEAERKMVSTFQKEIEASLSVIEKFVMINSNSAALVKIIT